MLFTASTIKDSPENVSFFVEANLASGVDHMFVFLDAPRDGDQREVAAFLGAHDHVTCVPTTRGDWWAEDRPANLNVRQRINVNWARTVLEPFAWAEWLFHVDGDEVAAVDRDALAEVPADAGAVWLEPLEAVSQLAPAERPTLFKRLLDESELNLLHVLQAVEEPTNQAYFHGHLMGKIGVRPAAGLGLTLHDAVGPDGHEVPGHRDPRLRLLHYDAVSGEEFIRKWSALAKAGHTRYRPTRAPIARALRTLVSRDLPAETRERYLRRIYELTTLDDVALLADLGLLVEADPVRAGAVPRPFPADAAEQLAERVERMRSAPKRELFVVNRDKDQFLGADGRSVPPDGPPALRQRVRRLVRGR